MISEKQHGGVSTQVGRFDRITRTPGLMGGRPCIRGLRMTAGNIVSRLGAGQTIEELLADFPYLEREDILQALQYAGCLASGYTEEEEAWLTQGQEVEVSSRRVVLAN